MDRLTRNRAVLRRAFSKNAALLESLLDNLVPDKERITVLLTLLSERDKILSSVDKEMFDTLLDEKAEEDTMDVEVSTAEEYHSRFLSLKVICERVLNSIENPVEVVASNNTVVSVPCTCTHVQDISLSRKYKLPTIELKKFNGDVKEWLTFWSQFTKIHEDDSLDLADKFQYLIQATTEGSRARELVASFPPTAENYEKVVESLKARFGREDFLIEVYVRELLKLVLTNSIPNQPKMNITTLYDKIETQLRALESLGITTDICAAMLYPLVESCLPEELLRVFQRSSKFSTSEENNTMKRRLENLISFLRDEVQNEERISLAVEGFGMGNFDKLKKVKTKSIETSQLPAATGLISFQSAKCIFCEGSHKIDDCFKSRKMTLQEKQEILRKKRACFRCMKIGHQSRRCRERISCIVCGGRHVVQLCLELPMNKKESLRSVPEKKIDEIVVVDQNLANRIDKGVMLMTLRVKLQREDQTHEARVIIDTGSQRSYILKETANRLRYPVKNEENIVHELFGGFTSCVRHFCYQVKLSSFDKKFTCSLEVLDQSVICGEVSPIGAGIWSKELRDLKIDLSDTKGDGPIELLIGADIAGRLLTGRRKVLQCGLVAIETFLGWTLMGKLPEVVHCNSSMVVASLIYKDFSISQLWELDVLGIKDPNSQKSLNEKKDWVEQYFNNTISINEEGRYEVRLLWLEDHPPLPNNYLLAKKRLDSVIRKLKAQELHKAYGEVFNEWLTEGIIEEVPSTEIKSGLHYLAHHPVIKENSLTTKIRPVFDASAAEKDAPSLNQCLEKGENLIELIPSILLKFRKEKIGVVSDIRKAFLQISLDPIDRDYLRFLWQTCEGEEKIYRHKRVVFGVNCSPYLLGATINYHIDKLLSNRDYNLAILQKLKNSFYVDNCVTSVSSQSELERFIYESTKLMAVGKFDLRLWEYTDPSLEHDVVTSVLGLSWNKKDDTLSISKNSMEYTQSEKLTKRVILSWTHRVFDPVGFTAPVVIVPKILLQDLWKNGLKWDDEVSEKEKQMFLKWVEDLHYVFQIKIPRWILTVPEEIQEVSLHLFCDASQSAYAAVIFLRAVTSSSVQVRLLQAKSRVAPVKKMSVPRLELLAATIGSRLYAVTKKQFNDDIPSFFWSDSTTVLSWIKHSEEWSVFVYNRVKEIRVLTSPQAWHHVPGNMNPADVPSRGCSGRQLYESRWWEGPKWLYLTKEEWPQEDGKYDETEINQEKKKSAIVTLISCEGPSFLFFKYFSSFKKNVRQIGWMFRFVYNSRYPNFKRIGGLTTTEINFAEKRLIKLIQGDSFQKKDASLLMLKPFEDDDGILRLKTRICNRKDFEDFRYPLILPGSHFLVHQLIREEHNHACHVGVQGLMSILRERYWIIGGRRTIRKVISKCVICRRQDIRKIDVVVPPLPYDRVRDASVFEVTGIDMFGPLFSKNCGKSWICLFTCAVYRAVHLELVNSLSTDCFLQAFRRFVARRGRPSIIYSDNAKNFEGASNSFKKINWEEVESCTKIEWRFNPPSAPWWGGWWERLIGLVKKMLRKVLGRSSLFYEELITILCDIEAVINSRPLCYMSNDADDLAVLTPAIFLMDLPSSGVPECDKIDALSLHRRNRYRQNLKQILRKRFRNEYLGQLRLFFNRRHSNSVEVGDIVLIGNDTCKRMNWPLGRVIELLPGTDGVVRLVRVQTKDGLLLRPIQRIYTLECKDAPPVQTERSFLGTTCFSEMRESV